MPTFRRILRTAFYCSAPFSLAFLAVAAITRQPHPPPHAAADATLAMMILQSVLMAAVVLSYIVLIATPITFWRSDPKLARAALLVIAFCLISSGFAFPAVP